MAHVDKVHSVFSKKPLVRLLPSWYPYNMAKSASQLEKLRWVWVNNSCELNSQDYRIPEELASSWHPGKPHFFIWRLNPLLAARLMPSQWQRDVENVFSALGIHLQSPVIKAPTSLGNSYKPQQKPQKLLEIITVNTMTLSHQGMWTEIMEKLHSSIARTKLNDMDFNELINMIIF